MKLEKVITITKAITTAEPIIRNCPCITSPLFYQIYFNTLLRQLSTFLKNIMNLLLKTQYFLDLSTFLTYN